MQRFFLYGMGIAAGLTLGLSMLPHTSSAQEVATGHKARLVSVNHLSSTESPVNIVRFASGTDTKVFRFDNRFLGLAQNVCLNESNPANCPPGATLYGLESPGWLANLSEIPTSTWIYAPGITGLSSPAEFNIYFFETAFEVPGTPTGGTFFIAADDSAQVFVNGMKLGTIGSTTIFSRALDAANSPHALDIGPLLVSGKNHVRVRVKNGEASFGNCGIPDNYACNPSGVVFGGFATW